MNINDYLDYYTTKEIKDMAYYLILLFYKTNRKYGCYRAKINRLLTIFVLCNLKNKPNLKDSKFYITEHFMGLREINEIIKERDIYINFNNNDSKEPIIEEFIEPKDIPIRYKEIIDNIELNDETKNILEIIFRQFGSYSINDLAPLIDSFKSFLTENYSDEPISIDVDKFYTFINLNEIKEKYKDNEIFNFILNYYNNINLKPMYLEKRKEDNIKIEIHNRLVRDKIPELIKEKKDIPVIRNVNNYNELKKELLNNLLEDYNKLNDQNKTICKEVLSDMISIIKVLANIESTTLKDLIDLSYEKDLEYGSYKKGIYLERVLRKEREYYGTNI